MVPERRVRLLLACGVVAAIAVFVLAPVGPTLGTTTTDPPELAVSSFERLNSGCADDIHRSSFGRNAGDSYTQVGFVETGNESANLSVRTERTSPPGADLTAFRVYLESTDEPQANRSCTVGIRYRLELTVDGEQSQGLFDGGPDGIRVLYFENGRYNGCSQSVSGGLDANCQRFGSDHEWTNATTDG